jgi:hypothetical protein
MLGVYGILMEMSDIVKVPVSTKVLRVGRMGEVVTQDGIIAQDKAFKEQKKRLEPAAPRSLPFDKGRQEREFERFMSSFGKGRPLNAQREQSISRATWRTDRKGRSAW